MKEKLKEIENVNITLSNRSREGSQLKYRDFKS